MITLRYPTAGTAVKKTTENTLDRHQRGMPDESLPLLFQEAVALARRLDIPYLWIDSLCIIQDSEEDKEEEIKKMSDIFREALIVVVAASVPSPQYPLRGVKPQFDQGHTWRTASLIDYKEMGLDVKFRKRARDAHFSTDATASSLTGKRAWCFQEKLLASRCLVFLEDEVVWECRSCCLRECGGDQKHSSVGNSSAMAGMQPYQKMLLPLVEHEPVQLDGTLKYFENDEAAYSFWETAVNKYSRAGLSLRSDRLPAISALASTVAKATGDRYLAGLWRNELLAELAWIPNGSPKDNRRPNQESIVPTWSWASHPGAALSTRSHRIQHSRDADNQATVLDARTSVKGSNLYGPVFDATILLSGVHCDVVMAISEYGDIHLDFGHGKVETDCGKVEIDCMGDRGGIHSGIHSGIQSLDFMPVEPETTVVGSGDSPWLRRVTDWQKYYLPRDTDQKTDGPRFPDQLACSGTVRLLWLEEGVSLILTLSHRWQWKHPAYDRLGIFIGGPGHPKMPKNVHRSMIKLV